MVHLTAAQVAERAAVGLSRLLEIEGDEAVPSFSEVATIFNALRSARRRQLRRHHEYCG